MKAPLLRQEQYETLLGILEEANLPVLPWDAQTGCYVVDSGNEAVIIGDESAYLSLIQKLLQILARALHGIPIQGIDVYSADECSGVVVSNAIQGEVNNWHSHLNLMALYLVSDREAMNAIAKQLGWYRD